MSGATRYRIYRGVNGVWSQTAIASTEGLSWNDNGVVNGTPYSYKVAASNSSGTGPMSVEVTAMPLAPPGEITATAGDHQVSLAWLPTQGATR